MTYDLTLPIYYGRINLLNGVSGMGVPISKQILSRKVCATCGKNFWPKSGVQKYCGAYCKGAYKYQSGQVTNETQYEYISGNWRRYFVRLRSHRFTRQVTADQLMALLQGQAGKCALTGQTLTCQLVSGQRIWTNASMDRIIPGGPYIIDNIQLVCAAINLWRGNVPLEQFIHWCHLVAQNNEDTYAQKQEPVRQTLVQEGRLV